MTGKYALLNLYCGFASSDGCPEVRFEKLFSSVLPYLEESGNLLWRGEAQQIRIKALQAVRRNLQSGLNKEFDYCYSCLIPDEKIAAKVIDYAQDNIPGARERITLLSCMHGRIKFNRDIAFEGINELNRIELVDKFINAGFKGHDWDRSHLEDSLDYYSKQGDAQGIADVQARLAKIDPRKVWLENLKLNQL
ncbi:MAG: hypothetical protein WCK90_02330 [archaeon]